jgi:hypothetical protein
VIIPVARLRGSDFTLGTMGLFACIHICKYAPNSLATSTVPSKPPIHVLSLFFFFW